MGLRFRRSWSLVPGIRFNVGLKSGSVSFGTRGLHYTVGTSGSRITAGIPGTGLSWTQKLKSPFGAALLHQGTQTPIPAAAAQPPQAQQPRPGVHPTGAVAQFSVPQRQTLSPFVGAQPPQLSQPQGISLPLRSSSGQNGPTQKPMQLSGYSMSATSPHLVVPAWLVWAVLAAIVVACLCFLSAMVGTFVR
jgi:hypothetical protein